jgi:lipoprotein-anchoring transpeptidase ErfK/SrfK
VRVFRHGRLIKRYHVAIGTPRYPTPFGLFAVQTMQRNPPWNVPHSAWAGGLAGKTIPGGDPRNPLVARWIGFDGSVGFHGTREALSIGRAASHGCVRMHPRDVIDLYRRVSVGTTVLVGT